jgi:hypothetical protein
LAAISWSGNATTLFLIAKNAVQTIDQRKPSERAPGQPEAIIAIVFSAMALEAFINEAADIAAFPVPSGNPAHPLSVVTFAGIEEELKGSKNSYSSIHTKFLVAKWVFAGESYNKGIFPYQDFHLLIALRNTLAHIEGLDITKTTLAGEVIAEQPSILEKLLPKKILAAPTTPDLWLPRIATLETARWACNTATAMYRSLVEVIPDGELKTRLDFGYSPHFQTV